MKIIDLLRSGKPTYSFEFFPPRNFSSILELGINVGQLMKLSPSFISVTYGAGGSTQEASFDLTDYLQNKIGLTTMAHYTCINAQAAKVAKDLEHLSSINIENLILLRGDRPASADDQSVLKGDFQHASDLIRYASGTGKFCIGAAGYPEMHPESATREEDLRYLKYKVDQGADFIITQLFFDNNLYFDFVARARANGIETPIIPGIMPVTNFRQIRRFTQTCGASIPWQLEELLAPHQDHPDKTYQIGVDFAIKQCRALLSWGAPGLHFYTLNKSRATVDIFHALRGII